MSHRIAKVGHTAKRGIEQSARTLIELFDWFNSIIMSPGTLAYESLHIGKYWPARDYATNCLRMQNCVAEPPKAGKRIPSRDSN